jgi:hypothetical protein
MIQTASHRVDARLPCIHFLWDPALIGGFAIVADLSTHVADFKPSWIWGHGQAARFCKGVMSVTRRDAQFVCRFRMTSRAWKRTASQSASGKRLWLQLNAVIRSYMRMNSRLNVVSSMVHATAAFNGSQTRRIPRTNAIRSKLIMLKYLYDSPREPALYQSSNQRRINDEH